MLQETVNTLNTLTENNFFEGKNVHAYQKNKSAPQALLLLIQQMSDKMLCVKYEGVVMADLESAFDAVWKDGVICKLYEGGIRNNMLSIFDSFLCDRLWRNLVNTYSSNWVQTHRVVPQASLLSLFIFFVYNSDLTTEEETPDSNYTKSD